MQFLYQIVDSVFAFKVIDNSKVHRFLLSTDLCLYDHQKTPTNTF